MMGRQNAPDKLIERLGADGGRIIRAHLDASQEVAHAPHAAV